MGELRFHASNSEGRHEEHELRERILEEGQWKEGAKQKRFAAPVSRKLYSDGERKNLKSE